MGRKHVGDVFPLPFSKGGSELSSRVREQGFDLVGHEVGDE
jgi:hypothetical protein